MSFSPHRIATIILKHRHLVWEGECQKLLPLFLNLKNIFSISCVPGGLREQLLGWLFEGCGFWSIFCAIIMVEAGAAALQGLPG